MSSSGHGGGGHAGRPKSWVAVSVMFIGFLVGGLALPIGPNWIMFWTGVGIVVVGGILALIFDIVSDVVVAQPYVSRDPAKRAADEARAAELRAARQRQAAAASERSSSERSDSERSDSERSSSERSSSERSSSERTSEAAESR